MSPAKKKKLPPWLEKKGKGSDEPAAEPEGKKKAPPFAKKKKPAQKGK